MVTISEKLLVLVFVNDVLAISFRFVHFVNESVTVSYIRCLNVERMRV